MQYGPLSLRRAFAEGFAAFKRQPGLSLGGYIIGDAIAGMFWPFIGGPMIAGMCLLFLKIGRNEQAEIGDRFSCFKDFWKWTGIFWSIMAMMILLLIPFAAILMGDILLVWRNHHGMFPLAIAIYIVSILLYQIARVGVLAKWGPAYFEGLDSQGVDEALGRSIDLTSGVWMRLWFMLIVVSLFSCVGLFACYFGVIISSAISMNVLAAIHLELRRLEGEGPVIRNDIATAE